MERKTTLLEQDLIKKGFKLVEKTYKGNKSQFVEFYVYKGHIDNYTIVLYLNQKRNNIHFYKIENTFGSTLSAQDIYELNRLSDQIFKIVYDMEIK